MPHLCSLFQVKPLADHRLQEGGDFIPRVAAAMEDQGLTKHSTAVSQLRQFVKNAQCPKSLLRWLLTLDHKPTGHTNVLERYGMELDSLCKLMMEHRVMFESPVNQEASANEAEIESSYVIPTKLPTEPPSKFDTQLRKGQMSCMCRVEFNIQREFPPGLVETTMAALQDVDDDLRMQSFFRFGGVLYNQAKPNRKALFLFEYPTLMLQVQAQCKEEDEYGREEMAARLSEMKQRVQTVTEVFKGLRPVGLEPEDGIEFAAYDAEAAAAAARPKVHATFATRMNSATMQSVTQHVHAAGCEWTTDHTQTEAWFEEWSRKAREADFLLVLFTPEYKNLFSWALEREADMIRQVCAT